MKEISKTQALQTLTYHNDLNKIRIPNLTELEQNLFCKILFEVKKKIGDELIILTPEDIQGFANKNLSNREITEILNNFEEKLFNADFTIIVKDEERNLIGKMRTHLFNTFHIYKNYDGEWDMSLGDFKDLWEEFLHIEIEVNKHFEYLVKKLTANFTSFELAEFISLSGKHTKTLYRHLKQYRKTGYFKMEWQEFVRVMDIPESYQMCDIEKRILKPAIKELTKPRNLFDQERIPFENLTYTKLKGKGRGRGGNVIGIEFKFKKQEIEVIENNTPKQESEIEKTNTKQNHKKSPNLNAYAGIHLENITTNMGSVSGKILSVCEVDGGFVMSFSLENGEIKTFSFDTQEMLEECVNKFQI